MVCCSIRGCKSTSNRNTKSKDNVTFHKVPKNKYLRQKWMLACFDDSQWPSENSRICSKHFKDDDFYLTKLGYNKLQHDVIPSLNLPLSENAKTNISDRRKNTSRKMKLRNNEEDEEEISSENDMNMKIEGNSLESDNEPVTISKKTDIGIDASNSEIALNRVSPISVETDSEMEEILDNPKERKLRNKLKRAESMLRRYNQKILNLQQQLRRMNKKKQHLKKMVEVFTKEKPLLVKIPSVEDITSPQLIIENTDNFGSY